MVHHSRTAIGLAALALAAVATGGAATATADVGVKPSTARERPPLPSWVRAIQGGRLDVDRALVGALALADELAGDGARLRTAVGFGPERAAGLVAAVVGGDRTPGGLLGALLEPPRLLTQRPVPGGTRSAFGTRRDPIRKKRIKKHNGIDMIAARNTPVLAAGAGVVTIAGRQRGYGRVVYLDHGGGLQTRYAHLQWIGVRVGDDVAAGQLVGRVGSSGRSTGPHLHFEVRLDGVPTPPDRIAEMPLFDAARGPVAEIVAPLVARAEVVAATEAAAARKVRPTRRARTPTPRQPARRGRGELRSKRPQS